MIIPQHTYQKYLASCKGIDVVDQLSWVLPDVWTKDYCNSFAKSILYTIDLTAHGSAQSYLFDIERGRVIAAWGVPVYVAEKRDASRQSGHPKAGTGYVKGHLIAHSLGGGMDINVIPQLRKVNGGEFRKLERMAQELAESGVRALYFVHCNYSDGVTQKPTSIEQVLIEPPNGLFYSVQSNL